MNTLAYLFIGGPSHLSYRRASGKSMEYIQIVSWRRPYPMQNDYAQIGYYRHEHEGHTFYIHECLGSQHKTWDAILADAIEFIRKNPTPPQFSGYPDHPSILS